MPPRPALAVVLSLLVASVGAETDVRPAAPATPTMIQQPRPTPLPVAVPATAHPPLRADPRGLPVPRTRGRLVIHAVGDVNFALSHNSVFATEGYDIAWEGVDGLFTRDHLTIINLECSPSEAGRVADPNKKWSFRCPIAALAPMRDAGIDVANLANCRKTFFVYFSNFL